MQKLTNNPLDDLDGQVRQPGDLARHVLLVQACAELSGSL